MAANFAIILGLRSTADLIFIVDNCHIKSIQNFPKNFKEKHSHLPNRITNQFIYGCKRNVLIISTN